LTEFFILNKLYKNLVVLSRVLLQWQKQLQISDFQASGRDAETWTAFGSQYYSTERSFGAGGTGEQWAQAGG
jgi:hypothetical protein